MAPLGASAAAGAGAAEQWVVPSFNSAVGFGYGLYDEDTEVVYFD